MRLICMCSFQMRFTCSIQVTIPVTALSMECIRGTTSYGSPPTKCATRLLFTMQMAIVKVSLRFTTQQPARLPWRSMLYTNVPVVLYTWTCRLQPQVTCHLVVTRDCNLPHVKLCCQTLQPNHNLVIYIGISLSLAGTLSVYQRTFKYLQDSYATACTSTITVECSIFLPLVQWKIGIQLNLEASRFMK